MSSPYDQALALALRKIRAADRFEEEIRRMLEPFETDTVDSVLANLRQQSLLNDRRTAEQFLIGHRDKKALGAQELRRRLLDRGASLQLVEELCDQVDDLANCNALIAKSLERFRGDRSRAGRFLLSRGFESEQIDSALDAHFGVNED